MRPVVIVPVEDREYETPHEVYAEWDSGKEFVIDDETCEKNGQRIAKAKNHGYARIHIRYNENHILAVKIIMNER